MLAVFAFFAPKEKSTKIDYGLRFHPICKCDRAVGLM